MDTSNPALYKAKYTLSLTLKALNRILYAIIIFIVLLFIGGNSSGLGSIFYPVQFYALSVFLIIANYTIIRKYRKNTYTESSKDEILISRRKIAISFVTMLVSALCITFILLFVTAGAPSTSNLGDNVMWSLGSLMVAIGLLPFFFITFTLIQKYYQYKKFNDKDVTTVSWFVLFIALLVQILNLISILMLLFYISLPLLK